MNWDDVRIFLALARSRTLAGAASSTGQDATTVSRRLRRLEASLGAALFEQTSTGQTLTEAGSRLLAHAEAMETSARAVRQEADVGSGIAGTLRISVSEGFGAWFIARRLNQFALAHPNIAIDLVASTGFLNPSKREADIAIMLARPKGGPLIAGKLTDYRLGAYAAQQYVNAVSPIDSIDELTTRRLIGYVPNLIYAPELRYLAEIDERLEPDICSSSITAQAWLIGSGVGCGILPCFIGDATPGLIRLLPDKIALRRTFWLVVHRDMRRVARVETFISWLRQEVGKASLALNGQSSR